MVIRESLQVDPLLVDFVESELLPVAGVEPGTFWTILESAVKTFADENGVLLRTRDDLQQHIDTWLLEQDGVLDPHDHEMFLRSIGYLVDEPAPSVIETTATDVEIGVIPGPQLVVPATNARYVLNAANARWGSLYDALYGTDALGTAPPGAYDAVHGSKVIAWVRGFLDACLPLQHGSFAGVRGFAIIDDHLEVQLEDGTATTLVEPAAFIGYQGSAQSPSALLFTHNGLGIDVRIDRDHPIGSSDRAGISDVQLESAVSTIVDLEDSVSCVDAADKVLAYRHWLGLMTGSLTAEVHKETSFTRRMAADREYLDGGGQQFSVPGRSLLLVRNVGLHMYTDAVLDTDGNPIPEGLVDLVVSVTAALVDLRERGAFRNSRSGSIYLVKPKLHGPEEVAFFVRQCDAVENALGLPAGTIKIGLMDEERRTSVNLAACIAAASSRIAFINTGFLDRTGDEIHTSMNAGALVGKSAMRSQPWILAYEDRNVDLGLAFGFQGRAQIGKGMWAAPARMADMLQQKVNHPQAGANCAWVPSPTAATLHATHYHQIDVVERQRELAHAGPRADRFDLLLIPLDDGALNPDDIRTEVDNCVQGILGYVVRWINQGVGCSTVPDINNVGLMEDRATLRISSQLLANWLKHGVIDKDFVDASFERMIPIVNAQNGDDPAYRSIDGAEDDFALQAAWALILDGAETASGYTEPALHGKRRAAKAAHGG